MRSSRAFVLISCLLLSLAASAQVLLPEELQDAGPHRLQLKYLSQLRAIGSQVEIHNFPFHFYFSRPLDISEKEQQKVDQRSIRFDRFQGYTVLAMSGNYFAAYSADLIDKNGRAKQTLQNVILPILQIEVPYFVNDDTFDGFAIEVSHHVRRKVMGISSETAENVMYYFPRATAQHIVKATTADGIQDALLGSKIYVNAEPFNLWVNGERPSNQPEVYVETQRRGDQPKSETVTPPVASLTVSEKFIKPTLPSRLITPKTLDDLKVEYGAEIIRLERDLREQTHLASYVATQFVGFHEGVYLQLSILYEMSTPGESSRYKLAALAFDDHVSHLIRGSLAHFQNATDFDGVVFSVIAKPKQDENSVAIEYFVPFQSMRCYARYDCTGQELLDSGIVLINGERASLNLQVSESVRSSTQMR